MMLKALTLLASVSLTVGQGFGGFQVPNIGTSGIATNAGIDNLRNAGQNVLGTIKQQADSLIEQAWGGFTEQFNKVYATPEESKIRREIFIENMKKIKRLNDDFGIGKYTFVQKVNEYADMLHNEFNSVLNGFNRITNSASKNLTHTGSSFIPSANVVLPESIDWRELGAVTPVKSQGLCGGCYAFSAAGALEGHWFRKTGVLKELSPQNLIDCTRPYENEGCEGGLMEPAFQYVKDNAGIDTLESYPYEAKEVECRYKPEGLGATDTGYVSIPEGDENALKAAVATLGPVSVGIDASRDSLQFYADGVYFDPECKNDIESVNHAVLVVGYGTDPDGKEFWLVKNSYGTGWGIGGYIKMARNAGNHCGIATIASYPLV